MNRLKQFFINTIIGGLLVILPVALFLFIMNWVFGIVRAAIAPLTNVLLERTALPDIVADVIVVVALILLCFVETGGVEPPTFALRTRCSTI